eukprot:gene8144-16737_t
MGQQHAIETKKEEDAKNDKNDQFNVDNYKKWNVLIGNASGKVFLSFEIELTPIPSIRVPQSYVFTESNTSKGIANLICSFQHHDSKIEKVVCSDVNGLILVPVLQVEGKWTVTTVSRQCSTFFETFTCDILHLERLSHHQHHHQQQQQQEPLLPAAITTATTAVVATKSISLLPPSLTSIEESGGSSNSNIEISLRRCFGTTSIGGGGIKIPPIKNDNNSSSNSNSNYNNNSDMYGKLLSSSDDIEMMTTVKVYPLQGYDLDSKTTTSTPHSTTTSTTTSCCCCHLDTIYVFDVNDSDSDANCSVLHRIRNTTNVDYSILSAILVVNPIVEETYPTSTSSSGSSSILVHAIATIVNNENTNENTIARGIKKRNNNNNNRNILVKYQLSINGNDDDNDSEELFNVSNYRDWTLLVASGDGTVFAKFNIHLSPKSTLLIPKSYHFIDKYSKIGISNLKCILTHISSSSPNNKTISKEGIEGNEGDVPQYIHTHILYSNADGVVTIPNLALPGHWHVKTSFESTNIDCDSFENDVLYMGTSSSSGGGSSDARDQVVQVSLSRYFHTITEVPSDSMLALANNIPHSGMEIPSVIACGVPISFDVPRVTVQGELNNRLANQLNSGLSAVILNRSDDSKCDLEVEATTTGTMKLDDGGGNPNIRIQIKTNEQNKFNMKSYGEKVVMLAGIADQFVVNIEPEDDICLPQTYEYYDNITNQRINSNPNMKFTVCNEEDKSQNYEIQLKDINSLLPQLATGIWSIKVDIPGYDQEDDERVISYQGRSSHRTVVKKYLNREHSLAEGFIRVVLSWGQHPRDLDIHCVQNGSHVYYGSRQAPGMSLDVDVTTGFGPETITIPPLVNRNSNTSTNTSSNKSYWISVHHYSGEQTLSTSNARIKVLLGVHGSKVKTITEIIIPNGVSVQYGHQRGIWEVLCIDECNQLWVYNNIVIGSTGMTTFASTSKSLIYQF